MRIYINTEYWPDHSFNRKKLLRKARDRFHNGGDKKMLLSIMLKTGKLQVKKQEIGIETCQKKKKKQKENIKEKDITIILV